MKSRVLFLSNVPWDFVWQRHQTLASLWAREAEVDYVELPGMRSPGWRDLGRILRRVAALLRPRSKSKSHSDAPVRLIRPMILPAVTEMLCGINARLVDRIFRKTPSLRGPYTHVVIYTPARTALQWLDRVEAGRVIYDCTDDLTTVRGVPGFFVADEAGLMQRADLTVVPSRVLYDRKRTGARRIERLPHGAQTDRFLVPPKDRPVDGRLTLLYYGHLHQQHLDFAALDTLARARPSWRLILVGPVRTPHEWPANVELPGQVEHSRLAEWVAKADVLLLPYVINKYTEAVMPAKTYECLATGRPVVAAPLPELTSGFSDEMTFVPPGGSWAEAVETVLRLDSPEAAGRRRARALENTWERRFDELRRMADQGMEVDGK